MQENELRIGNKVLSHLTKEIVDVDWLVMKHMEDGNIQSAYTPDMPVYEPILITPEILEACGFEKCSCDGYKHHGLHISKNDKEELYYRGIILKSLHQLQNLYFTLTGEELTINFPVMSKN